MSIPTRTAKLSIYCMRNGKFPSTGSPICVSFVAICWSADNSETNTALRFQAIAVLFLTAQIDEKICMSMAPNSTHRLDISNYLIHFTKGPKALDAFKNIVDGSCLHGGTGFIRGGYQCVCFTEAPLHAVRDILLRRSTSQVKYRPFGVAVKKTWLFEREGRPVIYQPEEEFDSLPENIRWRHMTYDPRGPNPVDFSWEREWRVKTGSLPIHPDDVVLVVDSVDSLRQVCLEHRFTGRMPPDIYDHLEDIFALDATFTSGVWHTLLLSNPECGWSGLDVDLD